MATKTETKAIFEDIVAGIGGPDFKFCVSREISPPIEDHRSTVETWKRVEGKKKAWWEHLWPFEIDDPNKQRNERDSAKSWTVLNLPGEAKPIPLERGLALERELNVALESPPSRVTIRADEVLPSSILENPSLPSDQPCGENGASEFYFSQPIIVGNTAFVEVGGVCGGLCGSGDIRAYELKDNKWQQLASKMTWIA